MLKLEPLEERNLLSTYVPSVQTVGGAVLQPSGVLQLIPQDAFPVYYMIEPGEVYYRDTYILTHPALFPDHWAHTDFNQAQVRGIVYIGNGVQTNYSNWTTIPDLDIVVSSGSFVLGGIGSYSNLVLTDGYPTARVPSGGGDLIGRATYNDLTAGPGQNIAVGSWNPHSIMVYNIFHGTTIYDDNAPETINYLDAAFAQLAQEGKPWMA
jgi:hypothetical protein